MPIIKIEDAVKVAVEYLRQLDEEYGTETYDGYEEATETLTRWMKEMAELKSE